MIGGHKVEGQGRRSRSGYRSWGQVGGGSRLGVQVGGQGLRRGQGLGLGRGQGCGQGRGVNVRVMIGGHKVWGQGLGSMLGVKVRGVVKVMGRGSMPGQMVDGGGWR